jgi:hypothetical protein
MPAAVMCMSPPTKAKVYADATVRPDAAAWCLKISGAALCDIRSSVLLDGNAALVSDRIQRIPDGLRVHHPFTELHEFPHCPVRIAHVQNHRGRAFGRRA